MGSRTIDAPLPGDHGNSFVKGKLHQNQKKQQCFFKLKTTLLLFHIKYIGMILSLLVTCYPLQLRYIHLLHFMLQ